MSIIARYENDSWRVSPDKCDFLPNKEGLIQYLKNAKHSVTQIGNELIVDGGKEDALFSVIQEFYENKEDVYPF